MLWSTWHLNRFGSVVAGIILALALTVMGSTTCVAGLVATFPAGNSGWHLGSMAAGRLDSKPGLCVVIAHRDLTGTWYLDAFRHTGVRLPGFPHRAGAEPINNSPALCDLDGDGFEEILFTQGASVIAMRADGSVLWSNVVNSANYVPQGGYQVPTNGFYWTGDGAFRARLPANAAFHSEVSPPMVVDISGSGKLEVVTAWKIDPDPSSEAQDFHPAVNDIFGAGEWGAVGESWSGGVVLFDATTGARTFVYHLSHLLEAGLAVGRPERGGRVHIHALNDSDSVVAFDRYKPHGFWGKGMLHRQFGKSQVLMSGSYQAPIDVFSADIDGDGLDECLVAGTQLSSLWQPNETILDDDGAVLWRRWLPNISFVNAHGWLNGASLIPVNPDHDNHADVLGFNHSYELSFRFWNGVELVDHPGWPKNFFPYLPSPPVVGDVDGDGKEEIVLGTYTPSIAVGSGDLLVYELDGTLQATIPIVGGLKHSPVLADMDGSGGVDVMVRSLVGHVSIYNFGSGKTNAVSWAGHYQNMRRDGGVNSSLFAAGTPMITGKTSGHNRVGFSWNVSAPPERFGIFRAEHPTGPFRHVATLKPDSRSYTDGGLRPGWQYFYEVAAVYGATNLRSSPFAVLSLLNSNLVANPGFEENEHSHWDKWFSGGLAMTNMVGTSNVVFQGRAAMQVRIEGQASGGSIGQYNQYGIPDGSIPVRPGAYYSYGGFFRSTGMSQASEHWLAWTSSKTGANTNNRPSLPWPDYFTPHFHAGSSPTDWTYVNRVFQMPEGIPNIELGHRFSMNSSGSGSVFLDNVFFRSLPGPGASNWVPLVNLGSIWQFQTGNPGAGWFAENFNAASWPQAKAKFGAGSGPTNVATRLPQLRTDYYFRKQFAVPALPLEDVLLVTTATDASPTAFYPMSLYLNGHEVSLPEVTTQQGNLPRFFDLTPYNHLLRPGTNTIAVQLRNYWADWDDVAFDLSLLAVTQLDAAPRLKLHAVNPCRFEAHGAKGTVWNLQMLSGSASEWQNVLCFTNNTGTPQMISYPSVNPGNEARLFRLSPR